MTHPRVKKLNALEASYTKASLLSYQSLLFADYLQPHIGSLTAQADPSTARLLRPFVATTNKLPHALSALAKKLGERATEIDHIIAGKYKDVTANKHSESARKYSSIVAGKPLHDRIGELHSSPLLQESARILQTLPEDPSDPSGDPGSTNTGGGIGDPGSPTDPGSSGSGGDSTGTGTSYLDYAPDVQQATAGLWLSAVGPDAAPYIQAGAAAVQGGGDVDINGLNATLTGIVVGVAASAGGFVGAGLASLALILIPRMLEAVEDALGDYLVGDLPGF